MAHPQIDNRTPFVMETIPQYDENFHPVYTLLIKATYDIISTSQLKLADEQIPVNFAGEYNGDPTFSSIKYEPECSLIKPSSDIVLIGHAYPEAEGDQQVKAGIKVADLRKTVQVFGDRIWEESGKSSKPRVSAPQPFEKIPLTWENAFGGTDFRVEGPEIVSHEPRNPVGKGYADKTLPFPDGLALPNIEDPRHLIKNWRDRPEPAGFGFTAPHWQPRPQWAGSYDEHWEANRKPLLPIDFERRFFNAATTGLISASYLQGNEEVIIISASDRGKLHFQLPAVPNPLFQLKFHRSDTLVKSTNLDTLIVNTDEHQVYLFWRALAPSPKGHLDLAEVNLKIPGVDLLSPTKKAT